MIEYMVLSLPRKEATDALNKMANDGWRISPGCLYVDGGHIFIVMEKERKAKIKSKANAIDLTITAVPDVTDNTSR